MDCMARRLKVPSNVRLPINGASVALMRAVERHSALRVVGIHSQIFFDPFRVDVDEVCRLEITNVPYADSGSNRVKPS